MAYLGLALILFIILCFTERRIIKRKMTIVVRYLTKRLILKRKLKRKKRELKQLQEKLKHIEKYLDRK